MPIEKALRKFIFALILNMFYEKYDFHYIGEGFYPNGDSAKIYETNLTEGCDLTLGKVLTMELLIKLLTVTGLGIIELWAAIPLGTALKLEREIVHEMERAIQHKPGAVL